MDDDRSTIEKLEARIVELEESPCHVCEGEKFIRHRVCMACWGRGTRVAAIEVARGRADHLAAERQSLLMAEIEMQAVVGGLRQEIAKYKGRIEELRRLNTELSVKLLGVQTPPPVRAPRCQICHDTGRVCQHSWRPLGVCDQTHVHLDSGELKIWKHAACDDEDCPCGQKGI